MAPYLRKREDITSDATIQDNNDSPPLQHVSALADLSSGGYLARIEKSKASAKSCPKRSVRRNAASGSSHGMSEQQVAETDETTKLGKGKKRRKVASAGKAKAGNRGEKKKKTDNKEYVIKSLHSYDAEKAQYEIEWLGYSSSYNLMQAADTIPGHFISEYWTRKHTITN
ncbi:uncharacterized protein LOC135493779 isoform X2 [Lineus longissimus]|uniref:uncharacterized protein LOC135493779 isoform X2 n=1 Tax=Lineus longissimus TaxID=88925 RepID=UPI00315D0193